jgi:hypothetical protein
MRTRALAISSGDVNGLVSLVWMTEMTVEGKRVLQSLLVGGGAHMLEDGRGVEEVSYGLLIVHGVLYIKRCRNE